MNNTVSAATDAAAADTENTDSVQRKNTHSFQVWTVMTICHHSLKVNLI